MAKRAQLDEVRPVLNAMNENVSKVDAVLDTIEAGTDKATDILEHGLEKVADVVPEALDKGVHVSAESTRKVAHALTSPRRAAITLGVVSLTAGAGLGVLGYFLLKKQLTKKIEKQFEARLDEEIEAMRRFYEKRATRKQPFKSPAEAAEALLKKTPEEALVDEAVEALGKYEGDQPPPGIISPEDDPREGNHKVRYDRVKSKAARPETGGVREIAEENDMAEVAQNVFLQQATSDEWNQEAEEARRSEEAPYVISHDEFMENTFEHGQNTLTYYKADDVLADERDQAIEEVESTVGVRNLTRFGHGSRDSNIVYIRNERLELDFEVTLNQGSYAEEVMGFQHSENPRVRKGRRGDDG